MKDTPPPDGVNPELWARLKQLVRDKGMEIKPLTRKQRNELKEKCRDAEAKLQQMRSRVGKSTP